MLQSMGLQRVGHDWATELNWIELNPLLTSWALNAFISINYVFPDILYAYIAIPFSRGSSQPRDQTCVSHTAGGFFSTWATRDSSLVAYVETKDRNVPEARVIGFHSHNKHLTNAKHHMNPSSNLILSKPHYGRYYLNWYTGIRNLSRLSKFPTAEVFDI